MLRDAKGRVIDVREVETGLRTVALEEIPDEDGSSFTLVVNGTRIFVKGGNWVPASPFPSQVTPGRYARLIGQARDARLNLLRSWGGGIYEGEAFWRECNRTGVMVSQDFLMACAQYPEDDPEFVAALREEFTAAIKLLRNYPALAFWCGDNELGLGSRPDDHWSGKKIAQELTGPLCEKLDPSRPFRLTSPHGGDPNNSTLVGDNHTNAQFSPELTPQAMRDYRRVISDTTGRFMSEHAVSGAPPKRTVLKFMTEKDLADPAMWEYHTKDNPYSGCPRTLFQIVAQGAEALYGGSAADIGRQIRQMEYVQYEFIRLAMESARRRKFWCSGIQFWMYNDCWPAAGWSVLDYWGNRKAAWYGMAGGFRPVIAAQEVTGDALRWWVCSDLLEPAPVELTLRVQPWECEPRWEKIVRLDAPANASVVAAELPLSEIQALLGSDAMFVCDLRHSGGADRSLYYPGLPREMHLPPARLTVMEHRSDDRGEGEITIHAENYARVVTLDSDVDFADNYFDLLPGETRTISWRSPVRPFADPIPVTCWNG
jgi:beta-mannosidase